MKLVTIEKNEIRLCSSMDESAFGKTNYESIVTEKGLLATSELLPDGKFDFSFTDWSFSDIKSFDIKENNEVKRIVHYCGKTKFSSNAKTLSSFDEEEFFDAGFAFVSLITQAATNGINIPNISGDGIIIDITKKSISILLLPENVYKYSAAGLPNQDFSNHLGFWINTTLTQLPFLCFMRSVVCYKMLTGKFPFNSIEQTERNADIMDNKFLPIDYCVNGIDKQLALQINKGLKLNSNVVNVPGKKKQGKTSEDLTPTADFPLQLLRDSKNSIGDSNISKEEFEERAKNYLKVQNSKINAKRKLRRNSTAILLSIAGVIILFFVIRSFVENKMEQFTSKGLNSKEVIQLYYKGMDDFDTITIDNISSGKNMELISDSISNIYVIGKSRQAYGFSQGIKNVGEWLWSIQNEDTYKNFGVYGITNLLIDSEQTEINPPLVTKKSKPLALTKENDKTLQDKDIITHSVEYFIVTSEDELNEITVEKLNGTIELTYKKDKWIITNFTYTTQKILVDTIEFKNTYFNSLVANDYDCIKAVNSIKDEYPWLPSEKTMQNAKVSLDKKNYNELIELEKQLAQ